MSSSPVYVTQPHLPPLEEFLPYLEKIWENKTLTNGGPMHVRLEEALCRHLKVDHIALFNNGTTALLIALQALRITGEVITTPYSFVATTHSLLWNGIRPVFVDIDPQTMNIDVSKIEAAITPQTTAIMPVHCYGNPCDVAAIQEIADNYNLRVIYDAAHAFGVDDEDGSILRHGDLSTLSFHATKVFNTFEGGAIVCPDDKTKRRIDNLKNFGIVDETTVVAPGINGKMSEINAAFGLLQLDHIAMAISRRREIDGIYRKALGDAKGITIPAISSAFNFNYSYFPILIDSECSITRDDLYRYLREQNIFSRRYFYPLISNFPMYRGMVTAQPGNLPVANSIAKSVLCLPIYSGLLPDDQSRVIEAIRRIA